MKKYVIAYFILFLVLLGLGMTHGIPFGIIVTECTCGICIGVCPWTKKYIETITH